MAIKVLDTRSPAVKTSFNQILSWFDEGKKTNVSVQTLFQENGWFWRCVDLRARSIQNMPWSITRSGSEVVVWDCDMPDIPEELAFAEMLPRFLYMWEASLVTVGKAYTLKESEGSSVDNLFYFNPLKVEPVKTAADGIVAYKRTVNSGTETYAAEDMLAMFSPSPFRENGPGAETAAKKNARVLRALDGFLESFLDKGLIKATILSVEGGEHVPEDQKRKLKDAWKKTIAGWFNGGEQHIFNSKVTPHTVGEGIKDLSSKELNRDQRIGVCTALGIPPALMIDNAANMNTADKQELQFYVSTVIPQAKFIMRELNKQLFSAMGYRFMFEPKKLEVMQQYELEKAQKVVALVGGPVLTLDEGRELLGMEALGRDQTVVMDAREEEPRQLEAPEKEDEPVDEQKAIEAIVKRVLAEQKPVEIRLDQVKIDGEELLYGLKEAHGKRSATESSTNIDIKNWKRRIKKKDNRKVRFEPDHLNDYETAVIRERLETDMPLEEVFSPPFVGF